MDAGARDSMGASDSERALVWTRQLLAWWQAYNRDYAHDRMRAPIVRLSAGTSELGAFDAETREIRISAEHVARDPWHVVMGTLRHEMAHQYAIEVLGAAGEPPHGPAFAAACRILRADPRGTAGTGARDDAALAADAAVERLTRRISKLLALGGSPNEHEATSAVRKARQLMLEHNLDVVAKDGAREFDVRVLGGVARRRAAWERALVLVLSEFFFVEVISGPSYDAASGVEGSSYFVYGTHANLAMAEYVHAYLSSVLPGLWLEHRRAAGLTGNRDRLQYFEGVMNGFLRKLRAEESARRRSANALVWRGDPALGAFFRWHNTRVRSVHGSARARGDAFEAGRAAGARLTLRRPVGHERSAFGGYLGG